MLEYYLLTFWLISAILKSFYISDEVIYWGAPSVIWTWVGKGKLAVVAIREEDDDDADDAEFVEVEVWLVGN